MRRGVCPIKEQMLQMLGKALLARLFNVKRVTERVTNGQRQVERVISCSKIELGRKEGSGAIRHCEREIKKCINIYILK